MRGERVVRSRRKGNLLTGFVEPPRGTIIEPSSSISVKGSIMTI